MHKSCHKTQRTYLEPMSNPTDSGNSYDLEREKPMVARLEIEQLGDAASAKQILAAFGLGQSKDY